MANKHYLGIEELIDLVRKGTRLELGTALYAKNGGRDYSLYARKGFPLEENQLWLLKKRAENLKFRIKGDNKKTIVVPCVLNEEVVTQEYFDGLDRKERKSYGWYNLVF